MGSFFQKQRPFKYLAMLIILAFFNVNMYANVTPSPDDASLSGFVIDESNGETLVGASVYVVEANIGAYTNKSGYFSITSIKPGKYTVRFSSIGYERKEISLEFNKAQSIKDNFKLKPSSIIKEQIEVVADREVEKRQISISKVNIPVDQMKQIRVGGESDVFRTIQFLPGVLTSSQVSSGLYIRGGSPDQNLVLLDGSTVYNPSHLFGFISTFNSEAIKDVEIIKGGYPAEYGSRLSAVLNITQKDGNREEYQGVGSIGALSSKLSFEGPVGKGSFFVSGRRTYFDIIKNIMPEDEENPIPDFGFYDLNGKISQDLSQNDKIYLSGFMSRDNFDFATSGLGINMFMANRAGSLRWIHIFGDNMFHDFKITGSNYSNGIDQSFGGYKTGMENSINDYSLKGNLEWFTSDKTTIKFGYSVSNYKFQFEQNFSGEESDIEEGTIEEGLLHLVIHDWVYNAFGQGNYQITDNISAQAGLRVNYWDKAETMTYDPRLAMRFQLFDDLAVKASWGIFHQYLRLAGDENFAIFDTWLPTDKSVEPGKAQHYILSFETHPLEDIDLNFDIYYKDLDNISEVNRTSFEGSKVSDIFFTGDGYAYGFEIFLQKKVGRFAGWLGYGFGVVTAKFDSINGGREFHPKYDRRHDFKIVAQYELTDKWTVGGTFMFQSGQPYSGASSRFHVFMPGMEYGMPMVVPTERFGLRLPPSHQLNLNGSYKFKTFGLESKLIIDIFNVYSRRDILMRFYDVDQGRETVVEDVLLLPIIPTVSFELDF